MKINNEKINNEKEHSLESDISLIKFKRKKTKSNIRLGGKLFIFLMLAGISGAFFSNLTMKIKYDKVINQFKENEIDRESVIFNYTDIIKEISPSLVSISDKGDNLTNNTYYNENSTGIILDDEGMILTNYSKVKDLENIYVKLAAKGTPPINAEFIEGNEEIDVALIKIKYDGDLVPVKLAKIDNVRAGQGIAILSNSIGDDYIGSINPGIITSTNKKHVISGNYKEYNLLEINAPINNENTGGAVCNSKGELIGIASLDLTQKNSKEGLFYAVDLSELEKVITSTTAFKEVLGLTGGSIVGNETSDFKGFYVENVKKGGNAYNAGIKPTDIVFEIDNMKIITVEDITNVLKNKKSGDTINCKVMRNGRIENIVMLLDEF
ncbi:MAG: S1C family serine protease [Terrisporobacter sp.]|uniref:S1C family serine protease n=1 Tax=Clostridia TaxID=186801 RepID=UPI002FC77FB7